MILSMSIDNIVNMPYFYFQCFLNLEILTSPLRTTIIEKELTN